MVHAIIIDDQISNIDVLAVLLEREGITYTGLGSPDEFSERIDSLAQFEVMFLDLEIPGHNMYDWLKDLRAHDIVKGVPIVAYSVHTSEIDMARRAGFDGFLGKPLDAYEFPSQIERILNHESVWEISR